MTFRSLWIPLAISLVGCSKTVSIKTPPPVTATAPRPTPPPPEPEPEPPRVEVKADRIQVNETILFEFNKATIRGESFGLLDEIAKVITDHGELTKIRIEGHTDSVGGAAYNLTLSKQRASAVMKYLVKKGVVAKRLVMEGYGLANPIADNDTEDGRAKNRRVAFTILERTDDTVAEGGS